jgi:NAD(P)-dependent dehydrogenase (short-subunit alcohol dehydrogenase family)
MICAGRVAIVTGAGRGLGQAHALELARQGARVVVNDVDDSSVAVAKEIDGVACVGDVADWAGARRLVTTALETWGRLDVLVNNAGFVRDRMLVATEEEEWDAVVRVHLRGHFAPTRCAAGYWREEAKAGRPVAARIINTTSGAGLLGSVGQAAYSAAKAGIATLTLVEAAELGRYGVTANAIAPAARTRMTETVFAEMMRRPDAGFDAMAPENVAPLVAWLASADAADVTGRIFEVAGGRIAVACGWRAGPAVDRGARWAAAEVGAAVRDLLAHAPVPTPPYGAK